MAYKKQYGILFLAARAERCKRGRAVCKAKPRQTAIPITRSSIFPRNKGFLGILLFLVNHFGEPIRVLIILSLACVSDLFFCNDFINGFEMAEIHKVIFADVVIFSGGKSCMPYKRFKTAGITAPELYKIAVCQNNVILQALYPCADTLKYDFLFELNKVTCYNLNIG